MDTKHTPTPWAVGELSPGKPYIYVEEERIIAQLYDKRGSLPHASFVGNDYLYGGQAEANAAFIVRAVNTHERALRILKEVADGSESNGTGHGGDVLIGEDTFRAAIALIAEMEGR